MTVTMRETVARGGTGSDTPTGMESRGIEFGVEIVAEESRMMRPAKSSLYRSA